MSGNLPGYTDNDYPVIKSGGTIHFANNGKYSAFIEGNNTYFGILNSSTQTKVFLNTAGDSYLTGGNLGIGTTSPANILDIGKSSSTPALIMGNSGYGTSYNSVWGMQTGAQSIMIFGNNGQNEIRAGNTNTGGYLDFYTNNTAAFTSASNGNFAMRLASNGSVGIGTTTPQVALDVNGNAGIIGSNYLYFGHSTTNIGAWQTRTYSSGGAQYWNVNGFQINNSGYGSSTWLNINSSGYTRIYERLGVGTDPSTKFHVSGGAVLLDTGYVNEYLYSINRSVASGSGSTTLIGSLASSGNSNRATIEIHHHDCGTIEYSMFELIGNYYTGNTTDWVQLPSRTQAHYAGDRNGVVVDARLASTGGAFELRLRSIGGACSTMGVNIKIRSNTALTESSTTGTGGTVAGLLGFNRYEFPVTDDRFKATSNGLFIVPSGRVGINNTSPGYALDVTGTIYASSDVLAYSDASVKENIREIPFALERIQKTRGILYDRIDTGSKNNIGFIAQELDEQFPELVETNPDGTKSVKYQNAVAVLVEAIKEQQVQIEDQNKEIQNLKALVGSFLSKSLK
jgi:hypothetical protein